MGAFFLSISLGLPVVSRVSRQTFQKVFKIFPSLTFVQKINKVAGFFKSNLSRLWQGPTKKLDFIKTSGSLWSRLHAKTTGEPLFAVTFNRQTYEDSLRFRLALLRKRITHPVIQTSARHFQRSFVRRRKSTIWFYSKMSPMILRQLCFAHNARGVTSYGTL